MIVGLVRPSGWEPAALVLTISVTVHKVNVSLKKKRIEKMWTGWTCHPIVICKKNDNRMGVPSGCHFQNKMRTGWNSSGCHTTRSKKLSICHRQPPKHQINYFNQQYRLLITNKHKKLLMYDLFEGLIEDLEERNETDELWIEWASSFSHQLCNCRSVRARDSKGCYGVNQMKTRVTPKASYGENNESD